MEEPPLLLKLQGLLLWRIIRVDARKGPCHATGDYDGVPRQSLGLVQAHYLDDVTVAPG